MKFTIEASKSLNGCKDESVSVRATEDKSLERRFDEGLRIKLTRD